MTYSYFHAAYLVETTMLYRSASNMTEIATVFFLLGATGCGTSQKGDKPMPKSNEAIFQEVNGAGLWFHAKKTRPIWVRLLEHEETVKTLEGEEQVPAGNYLCRGEAGDIWPQNKDRLTAKYTLTDEVDEQGWRKCDPKPDAAGVMAAQVSHAFQVQAKWGLLSGKPGDFIVKNYEDRDNDNPEDVWIVDQGLFEATYERVAP